MFQKWFKRRAFTLIELLVVIVITRPALKLRRASRHLKLGFTLIELLVVIVIIGILATLATVALNSTRMKARDAKRISDMKQMQAALELYFTEAGSYPTDVDSGNGSFVIGKSFVSNDGATTFMGMVPKNPQPYNEGLCNPGSEYVYTQLTNGTSYTIDYCLAAGTGSAPAGPATVSPTSVNNACTPISQELACAGKCSGQTVSNGCSGSYSCADSIPATVTGLASTGENTITWNAVSGVTNYKVYRSASANATTEIATSNTASYTDDSVTSGTYYYRVKSVSACNANVLSANYSNEVSFAAVFPNCPLEICGDCSSITCGDTCNTTITKDGVAGVAESYGTVLINGKCWMAKNISNVGTRVDNCTYDNDSLIERCCENNDPNKCTNEGAMYKWTEALYIPKQYDSLWFSGYRGSGSTAKIQGVCPKGWHIPSDSEFGAMESFIDSGVVDTTLYYADCINTCDGGVINYRGTNNWTGGIGAKMICTAASVPIGSCTSAAASATTLKFPLSGYWAGSWANSAYTHVWTSTQALINESHVRSFSGDSSRSMRVYHPRYGTYGEAAVVRCVKD